LGVARALEPLDIYWMEEPLHRGDLAGMRALRGATALRIAGGEMARELHELSHLIDAGALDVVQPDAALSGGITGLRRIAAMAEDHGLIFTPHTWTNGMGLIANAHLASGLSNAPFLEYPFDPPEWGLSRRDYMLSEPLRTDAEGFINLSDAPGMGYALDEEMLARTRVG
jgi:L-alanine-DL-glutamate epimerase-like enolase superfamily enzyme